VNDPREPMTNPSAPDRSEADEGDRYSFRAAIASDATAVAQLVDAAYEHYVERIGMVPGPMTQDYDHVIRAAGVHLAERDGSLVGVLVVDVNEEGFVIENVAVHPVERGKGPEEGCFNRPKPRRDEPASTPFTCTPTSR
jgi:hypothetical protein